MGGSTLKCQVFAAQGSDSSLAGEASSRGLISMASRARVKIKVSWAWVIWGQEKACLRPETLVKRILQEESNTIDLLSIQIDKYKRGNRQYLH